MDRRRQRVAGSVDRRRRVRLRRPVGLLALVGVVALLASSCIMNGTWTAVTPPPPIPPGSSNGLGDVSCVAADWCMGVGSANNLPVVQIWNGSGWTLATVPTSSPDVTRSVLTVECGTPSSCVAVVSRKPPVGLSDEFLVAWDGAQWHDVPPGLGIDAAYWEDGLLACSSDGGCLVVNQTRQVTVEWDGASFTSTPFTTSRPAPVGDQVDGLDCVAADACFAALSSTMARWDGTSWSVLPGSYDGLVHPGPWALDCSSVTRCLVFDAYTAALWDGTGWTAAPAIPDGFGHDPQDFSCTANLECLFLEPNGDPMLVWNGQGWFASTPPPDEVERLSCVDRFCLVLAGSVPYTYTWTNP